MSSKPFETCQNEDRYEYIYIYVCMYIHIYLFVYSLSCSETRSVLRMKKKLGHLSNLNFHEHGSMTRFGCLPKKLLDPFHQHRSPSQEACLPKPQIKPGMQMHQTHTKFNLGAMTLCETLAMACKLFVQNFNHFALQLTHDLLPHLGCCLLHQSGSNGSSTA